MNKTLLLLAPIAALALGASANAATICTGCELIDGAAATYIGTYNPEQFDEGTFNHTGIQGDVGQNASFTDFFVFDLNPGGKGSISADFTVNTGIVNFVGRLWSDGGSTCAAGAPAACSTLVPGAVLYQVNATNRRWEIIASGLTAGRYIIQVTGQTRASGPSSYTGQLSFVSEPGTLALFGLGLLGAGLLRRRFSA
jgi:hypothetical protein